VNVYDFDGTIYDGDSSIDFWLYCIRLKPTILRFIFKQAISCGLCVFGIWRKERCKSAFFSFVREFEDIASVVNQFWMLHRNKLKLFFAECRESDDVIISASPEFLLKPLCEQLGNVCLIARKSITKPGNGWEITVMAQRK
jgi:phosphoserine phosphatase